MQKKHGERGLVVVTVSVDPPDDKEKIDEANEFLRKQNPPFRHLLLDEPHDVWSVKLGFTIPPCYFVFDRQGRWTRLNGSDFDEEDLAKELDKVILQKLDEK